MKKAALIKGKNLSVIGYYYQIIIDSLNKIGIETETVDCKRKDFTNFDVVICGELLHFFFRKRKHCKRIFWFQGVAPEESLMRNSSRFRYVVLSYLEKMVLRNADFFFLVSRAQKEHYEKKYKFKLDEDRCFIMPCFNEQLHSDSFFVPNKYIKNIFCYVGSLSVWQCFDRIVKVYRNIEKRLPDAEFRVYTKEIDEAKRVLNYNQVKHYLVEYVPENLLHDKLKECKFGFVLRDNVVVNNVATPTKLSNYLANGVIPIFSDCILDFAKLADDYKYLLAVNDKLDIENIIDVASEEISPIEIQEVYSSIFSKYYNPDLYIDKVTMKLEHALL